MSATWTCRARVWLKGLVSAIISGAAGAVAVMIVDPQHFNVHEGWPDLLLLATVAGVLGGANYLRAHPTPWDGIEERRNGSVTIGRL